MRNHSLANRADSFVAELDAPLVSFGERDALTLGQADDFFFQRRGQLTHAQGQRAGFDHLHFPPPTRSCRMISISSAVMQTIMITLIAEARPQSGLWNTRR